MDLYSHQLYRAVWTLPKARRPHQQRPLLFSWTQCLVFRSIIMVCVTQTRWSLVQRPLHLREFGMLHKWLHLFCLTCKDKNNPWFNNWWDELRLFFFLDPCWLAKVHIIMFDNAAIKKKTESILIRASILNTSQRNQNKTLTMWVKVDGQLG